MGAVTATIDADGYSPVDASSAGYMVRCKITGSSSYATGGDTIAASILGLGRITKLSFSGSSDGGTGTTTAYIAAPVYDSSKTNVTNVQIFWTGASNSAVFAEITSGTDVSAVVFDAIAYGT